MYIVPCLDCDQVYVGETGRPLATRISEHKYACRTNAPNSAIAKHTLEDGHRINFKDASIICQIDDIYKRRIIEGALIQQLPTFPGNTALATDCSTISRMVLRTAPLRFDDMHALLPNLSPHLFPRSRPNARAQHQFQGPPPSPQDQPPGRPL